VDLSEELVKTGVAVFAGGTGVLLAGMMAIRKAQSQWKEMNATDTKNEALGGVYELLAKEISRMSSHNEQLSDSLRVLHAEVLALRHENSELRDEVEKLNHQIGHIRGVYSNCGECPKRSTRRGDALLEVTDGTTA